MHDPIKRLATDDTTEVLRPLVSLISKSEKALQKLTPGTWQHSMLRDNLKALHIASILMSNRTDPSDRWTRDDLQESLQALASMIGKTEKAKARFSPGTSQHTLLRNRLKSLRLAQQLIQTRADSPGVSEGKRL